MPILSEMIWLYRRPQSLRGPWVITDDELIAAILELFPYHTKEPKDAHR